MRLYEGEKTKVSPRMDAAVGVITTSKLVKPVYYAAYAEHVCLYFHHVRYDSLISLGWVTCMDNSVTTNSFSSPVTEL